MKRSSWLALMLGGVLCCGALQAGMSQAAQERREPVRAICESPRSADGDYSFDGSSSKEVNDVGDELASVFDQNRDLWGGVEFCRDYSGLRVYVKDPSSASLADSVKRKHPDIPIYFVKVKFSSLDLEQAQSEVMQKDSSQTLSTEADPEYERILVETGASSGNLTEVSISSGKGSYRSAATRVVVPVEYVGHNIQNAYAATRGNDASPFTSGGRYQG